MASGKDEAFGHSPTVSVEAMLVETWSAYRPGEPQTSWRPFMRRLDILVSALVLALAINGTALAASKSDKQSPRQAMLDRRSAAKEQKAQDQERNQAAAPLIIRAPKKHGSSSWLNERPSVSQKSRHERSSDLAHP
jgi:hypothetical protein